MPIYVEVIFLWSESNPTLWFKTRRTTIFLAVHVLSLSIL